MRKDIKAKQSNSKLAAKPGLSIKREMIRRLTNEESKLVLGGMPCQTSCGGDTCPNTICTITLDTTL